jgi:ABC-type dipeptide/oligopeptide/nickel transport system ATPase component
MKIMAKDLLDIQNLKTYFLTSHPMTCLYPVYSIGDQVAEALMITQKIKCGHSGSILLIGKVFLKN